MSRNVVNLTARLCHFHRTRNLLKVSLRMTSTEAATVDEPLPPPSFDEKKVYAPKIVNIVENISQLTLREVADLNELLKATLNIKDIAVAAPVVQAGSAPSEEKEEEQAPVKDEFVVKLTGFVAADKIKLIKAIKVVKPSLNLVQAKKLVESLPQVVLEDAPKDECESVKKTLEEAGGTIEIV